MEYGLWRDTAAAAAVAAAQVLILVLMEYGLWLNKQCSIPNIVCVLILVLMEYGLWLNFKKLVNDFVTS